MEMSDAISIDVADSFKDIIDERLGQSKIKANILGISLGILVALILTGSAIGIAVALIIVFRNQSLEAKKNAAIQIASYSGSEISKFLELNFQTLLVMTQSITQNNYVVNDLTYRTMASWLRTYHPTIAAYEYALGPDMTLEYEDPMPSPVLGLQLLRYNSLHATQIMKAISNRAITLYGPFPLIQGGIGMNAFYPIIYPNGTTYGLSSIMIMLNDVLSSLRIYETLINYNYQFINSYGIFAQNNGTTLINAMGTNATLFYDSVNVTLNLSNETWILSITPINGWLQDDYIWLEVILITAFGSLVALSSIMVLREIVMSISGRRDFQFARDALERQVTMRTREILQNNLKLVSQLEQREDIENVWGLSWIVANNGIVTSSNETFSNLMKESLVGKTLTEIFIEAIPFLPGKTYQRKLTLRVNSTTIKATIKSSIPDKITITTSYIDESQSSTKESVSSKP